MKYFKLFVALALLTLWVVALGFASGAGSQTRVTSVASGSLEASRPQELTRDSDDPVVSKAPRHSINFGTAVPEVRSMKPLPGVSSVNAAIPAGTYSIPGPYGASIASVVGYLNGAGVAGIVTFELSNTTYSEGAGTTFLSYTGNTNLVTFRPAAGKNVTVTFAPSVSQGKGFAFFGAKNVTINGKASNGTGSLTLNYSGGVFPTSDAFAATIYISGASDHITVKNTKINGQIKGTFEAQTDGRAAIHMYAATIADANTNITIDSCTIINATFGFMNHESDASASVFQNANTVNFTHNLIGSAYGGKVLIPILCELAFDLHVDYNIINGAEWNDYYWNNGPTEYDGLRTFADPSFLFDFAQFSGMHIYNTDSLTTVTNNQVLDVHTPNPQASSGPGGGFICYGILVRASNGGNGLVANNRISGLANYDPFVNTARQKLIGLRTENQNFYHNTIRLSGAAQAPTASYVTTGIVNGGTRSAIKNNIFENDVTGGTVANTSAMTALAAFAADNVLYCPNGLSVSGFPTDADAVGAGENAHGVFGRNPYLIYSNLHVDSTQASSASNIGQLGLKPLLDIDGQTRPMNAAPDAGADEFTGAPDLAIDVFPGVPTTPGTTIPASVAQVPIVRIKNNTNVASGAFSITLTVNDGYTSTKPVPSIPADSQVVDTFANWTAAAGTWTMTATTSLSDANNANNVATKTITATAPTAVVGSKVWNWNASDDGWTRNVDWIRSSTFTKLGGPLSGASMVTVMGGASATGDKSTYTEGAFASVQGYATTYPGANFLYSPFLNLSGLGAGNDLYVSFKHSLAVEPGWDGSWMEYSTDGVVWNHLGVVNDANGINWYNHSVYENSPSWDGTGGGPPDLSTMGKPGYNLYPGSVTVPMGWWSSNGPAGPPVTVADEDGEPRGPVGYVFAQLHVTTPAISRAPVIRFRYVAFSDAVNPVPISTYHTSQPGLVPPSHLAGWAIDDFTVGLTGPSFLGDTLRGLVYNDLNVDSVNNTEPVFSGLRVYLSYFGVLKDSTLTDGAGKYEFRTFNSNSGLPGVYNVTIVHPGFATKEPGSNPANINCTGSLSVITTNFGQFQGSISGFKYNDKNNNGTKDAGEAGLAGWTIEMHKDSCNGKLLASAVTDANGAYSFLTLPGTYYFKEVAQSGWRKTQPSSSCASVTTTIGAGVVTGNNFGNYQLGLIKIFKVVDLNGDGIQDLGDQTPLPTGAIAVFDVKKNGIHLFYDTLGNGAAGYGSLFTYATNVDTGNYSIAEVFATAPWIKTLPAGTTYNFTIDTSNSQRTALFMNYLPTTVSGTKWNDLNGNGVKDAGEPGLAGWTIHMSGNMVGLADAVTDVNGNFTIDSIGGGAHTMSEVAQAGWTETFPTTPGTWVFSGANSLFSGTTTTGKNFGNFKNICITVVKYRDRNNNGVRDAGEEGLKNWTININGNPTTTNDTGYSQVCNLGPTVWTVAEVQQTGWTQTQPPAGNYTVPMLSGRDTVLVFGNFHTGNDTIKYLTFSADDIEAGAQTKVVKPPKTGKPYTYPNLQSVALELFKARAQSIQVGKSGQLNAAGKEKAYVLITKAADFFKSLWDKGTMHTETIIGPDSGYRGFDFTNKAKPMIKKYKSLSPKVQNNDLAEELIVLAFNMQLSSVGMTQGGLANIVYNDGVAEDTGKYCKGFPLNGKTVAQIKAVADEIMTNYEGVPFSCYWRLEQVVSKINDAFSCGGVDCETVHPVVADSLTWRGLGKVVMKGGFPVSAIPYLRGPSAAPVVIETPFNNTIPDKYSLYQNYPNPFNPTTTLAFDLPQDAFVTLKIYNILGQEVATLYNHESFSAGEQQVDFDASTLSSGVYLYRIVAEGMNDDGKATGQFFTQVKKMMLLK